MDEQLPLHLSVDFGGGRKGDPLRLANPVMAAAGTFGTGLEVQRDLDLSRIGGLVTPAIGRRGRNHVIPQPITETPAGLLLFGPYPSMSLRAVIDRYAPLWRNWPFPVIANMQVEDGEECVEIASVLADHGAVAAIELGLPPDWSVVGAGGAAAVRGLCRRVIEAWHGPLIVKLPYGIAELPACVEAATEGGADAVSLGGGFPGRAAAVGRLVGPATHPLALEVVARICAATRTPIIASGGVSSGRDALDFLLAGAQAVQVGSASLRNPAAILDIVGDIEARLRAVGVASMSDFRRASAEVSPL